MKVWKEHKGMFIENKNNYDLINCETCGFKHIIPIPEKAELGEYYSKMFYTRRKPDYCNQQKESMDWWNIVYEERFDRLEKYIKNNQERKILDIGSGPGFFLKYGLNRGWDVLGIEPSEHAAKFSQTLGVKVINEGIEDIPINQIGKYDVIHMQGVLEHLREPIKTMELCKELLNENGLICFTVANEFNILQELLVENYNYEKWWFVPPEHINYFDIKSLEKFVEKLGFTLVSTISTFPMEMFLLMGYDYTQSNDIGKECQEKRVKFEQALAKNKIFKEQLYKTLASIGVGRTVEIIAYKN